MRAASSRRTTTVAEMCVRPAHSWLLPLYNAVSNKILWLTMVISSSGRCCWLLCLVSHWFVTEGAGTTLSRRLLLLRACSCINYRSVESLPTEQNIGRDLAAPMPANTSTEIHEKKEREKKTMRSRKKNYWRWKHVKRKMHTQHSLVIAVHLSFLHISLTKPQPPHWALFFFFLASAHKCVCVLYHFAQQLPLDSFFVPISLSRPVTRKSLCVDEPSRLYLCVCGFFVSRFFRSIRNIGSDRIICNRVVVVVPYCSFFFKEAEADPSDCVSIKRKLGNNRTLACVWSDKLLVPLADRLVTVTAASSAYRLLSVGECKGLSALAWAVACPNLSFFLLLFPVLIIDER